jgi:hypothetical protein
MCKKDDKSKRLLRMKTLRMDIDATLDEMIDTGSIGVRKEHANHVRNCLQEFVELLSGVEQ